MRFSTPIGPIEYLVTRTPRQGEVCNSFTSVCELRAAMRGSGTGKSIVRGVMDPQLWHKVAAISGVAALGLGTYGAHAFNPKDPSYKQVWQTASLYHLVHTAALLAAPITKHPNVFGGLLTTGIVAFSGTCYAVALLEDRKYARLAPFGGFAFIGAWASLLF